MYSVLKKVLEYRYPLYRSTGTRFKKLFLSIVFTILKKSLKHTTRTNWNKQKTAAFTHIIAVPRYRTVLCGYTYNCRYEVVDKDWTTNWRVSLAQKQDLV